MCCFIGEFVSLETKNDLLALVAIFGLMSPYVPANKMAEVYAKHRDVSWWTGGKEKGEGKVGELEEGEESELLGENLQMVCSCFILCLILVFTLMKFVSDQNRRRCQDLEVRSECCM